MKNMLLFFLLAAAPLLQAQSPDMDRYSDQFFRGVPLGPQNFNLSSQEDMLVSKAFLFSLEALAAEINGGSAETLVKGYGLSLYTEFTNYTEAYGRSTCGAPFLTLLAALRTRLMPYNHLPELIRQANLSREELDMALKKSPAYFPAYLGLAQWYLNAPASGGGSTKVAEVYLSKAGAFAEKPFQKYQVHVWYALLHKKNKNLELAAQEIAAAAALFPEGKFHTYISEQK